MGAAVGDADGCTTGDLVGDSDGDTLGTLKDDGYCVGLDVGDTDG